MRKSQISIVAVCIFLLLSSLLSSGAGRPRPPEPGSDGREEGGRPQKQQHQRSGTPVTGSAVREFSGTVPLRRLQELAIQSTKNDETALRIQKGAAVSIRHLLVTQKGNASSEEDSNFYSLNAAVAVWEHSSLTIQGGRIETHGEGANAFVAYGTDSQLKVAHLEICTSKNSSRGLHATYGGRIEGEDLKITTQGAHCAALATDRGGGRVIGRKIHAMTHGDGSPGIYSTGDITAVDSVFEAFDAEGAVIEGKNTILVRNCTLVGHRRCGTMLYQSFSGDAETGTSVITMDGGSLTAKSGPVFYVTNTTARVRVSNARLVSGNGVLIEAGSNRWGANGKNGGHLAVQAESQILEGDIVVNDISDVSLFLGEHTQLKGAINPTATAGKVSLGLGIGALWNVTADSSVDTFVITGRTLNELRSRIISNGHVIHYRTKHGFLNGDKIPLDHGGALVYTAAPKPSIPSTQSDEQRGERGRRGNRRERKGQRPPPPPDGFGGGHDGPPPDGFGGGHDGTPPDKKF